MFDDPSLDHLYDRFESAWKSGNPARIEDYLDKVDLDQRPFLLQGLLEIDLEFRLKRGDQLDQSDFENRFPRFSKAVQNAFAAFQHRFGDEETRLNATQADSHTNRQVATERLNETIDVASDGATENLSSDANSIQVNSPGRSSQRSLGRDFGEYELLEEIGRGGMGVVYKARNKKLDRIVALKMILTGEFACEESIQRFHSEAEAAAKLEHQGIVPIYQVGEVNGQHFFSMSFVEGQSLASLIAKGPLNGQEAASIVANIASAISYAHSRSVVHRDLKPANILIDSEGQPKVMDFGLAKRTDVDSGMTGTGQILGTPNYMSPEQASAKSDEVGPLSDVYSLGAILYCLLTGRPPFQAATVMDTLLQVINQEPVSPRQVNPAVDRDLETICLKCLAKEPRQRFGSAAELHNDLSLYLEGQPIKSRPVSRLERAWRWCRREPKVAILTAGIAFSLLLGAIFSTFFGLSALNAARVAKENEADAIARAEEARQLTYGLDMNLVRLAIADNAIPKAIQTLRKYDPGSPDADLRGFEWYYWNRKLRNEIGTLKGHRGWLRAVAISSDGKHVASGGLGGRLKIWDIAAKKELVEAKTNSILDIAFSPDGRTVATAHLDYLVRVWDTEKGQLIHSLKSHTDSVLCVAFSPNGTTIASGGRYCQ